jgi:hypothetical protein
VSLESEWDLLLSNIAIAYKIITRFDQYLTRFYPMVAPMSLKMHSLIWLDGVSGLSLICFVFWSGVMAQEWHDTRAVE